jgi:hypothetical protein
MSEWFVLNARNAEWIDGTLGKYCGFEPKGGRFDSSASTSTSSNRASR